MKKIISCILIFVLVLGLVAPCRRVYAYEEGDNLLDLLADCIYDIAATLGTVTSFASGDLETGIQNFINALNPDYGMDEWLADSMKLNQNGSIDLSADLYTFIKQFIEENATQKINISDYIYKYYPDKEISPSRVPVVNPSYNYIMNKTGSEGKAVMDNLIKHKYYWIAYAVGNSSQPPTDKITDSGGNVVGGARYVYMDTSYENDVIFIKSEGYENMKPFLYDKQYQTFSYVPMNYILYSYADSKEGYAHGIELNKYHYIESSLEYASDHVSSAAYYMGNVNYGVYWIFCGNEKSNYDTTGTPFNYYGTIRFPIWVSQEKYVEYMTLFPNYNPETYITNNEDNSVTINNYYYPENGDDNPPADYTDTLEGILREISAFRITFNLFIQNLETKIQQEILELQKIYDRQWTIYEMLESIYNKIQLGGGSGGSATDLDEVVKLLKRIDNKLLYNNVVDTIDAIGTWLDKFFGDDDEEETSLAKAALEEALQSRFPFSLMFSFRKLVVSLEAEPIAPIFEIPFKMEAYGINEVVVIDFTKFDILIGVVQWVVLLFYIYGLMMLTRKFLNIGGGDS